MNLPPGSTARFDFGDDTSLVDSAALPHVYARPGRCEVLIRIAAQQRLTEYRAAVVVSRQHAVVRPLVARPVLHATVVAGGVRVEPSLQVAGGESVAVTWRIDGRAPDDGTTPLSFLLQPGLRCSAMRPLTARHQRFDPVSPITLNGLALATNRTFDADTGVETTALNAFGEHVFGGGALAPADVWTFELPLEDNPAVVGVSPADTRQHYLGELADAVLALECVVREE